MSQHAQRFPDLVPVPLAADHLEPRDAALAHAIHDAAIRRWLTLTHLMNHVLRQPFDQLDSNLRGILLCGAVQLLFLDRIPHHAAIDETVEIAKRVSGRGSAGLVNAVLRKVAIMRDGEAVSWEDRRDRLPLGDGRALLLSEELLPEPELERLSVATSHSRWLVERWREAYGGTATRMALHSLMTPPIIFNTSHLQGPLPVRLREHAIPGHHLFEGDREQLVGLLEQRRDLWVQDPASSKAIASIAHLQPRTIIDVCAGQGTKTRQLAATFPQAKIIATDVDRARYQTLARVFEDHPRVEVLPLEQARRDWAGKADLVLLDVPCSNAGVLARRPEAKYRAGQSQLKRLLQLQRQIIADAISLLSLSPRGKILYSTCSIDAEENQEMMAWAVKWHAFAVEHETLTLPAGVPGDEAARYHDGSYSALLG